MKQPQFKTKQEVLRAYADLLDRHQTAGLDGLPPWKLNGDLRENTITFCSEEPESYEFPVAICEGKHVWLGDMVYTADGAAIQVTEKTVHLLDEFEMFWNATSLTVTQPKDEKVKFIAFMTHDGMLIHFNENFHTAKTNANEWPRIPSEDKEVEVLK